MINPDFLHYGTIALAAAVNSIGVGIGEGLTSSAAVKAINIQPSAKAEITKVAVLGMALIETAAIMGVSIALILLIGTESSTNVYAGIAESGIALAICLPGFFIGLVSAYPAQQACLSIARQPFFSQKILRFMLITQSVIQTPVISGFIIAMFIRSEAAHATTYNESIRLLASGLCIGLGSIGPALGLGYFARTACHSISVNRDAYPQLLSFTLVSQAIIETSVIFALVISILILFSSNGNTLHGAIGLLAAAICTGFGTFGAGISSGKTSAAACEQIALHPRQYSVLSRISMIAQGLIDTCAIYALVISILLILWR
jgi:F0F1-type ATP synthase membrane subunit c/vacuolar-type H+-ATPase subunit K